MKSPSILTPRLTRFDRVAFTCLLAVLALVFAYLAGSSLLYSSAIDPVRSYEERVIYHSDNVLVNLLVAAACIGLCRLVATLHKHISLKWFTLAALALVFAAGTAWALTMQLTPISDTGILYYAAADLVRGDPSQLLGADSYFTQLPRQLGYLHYAEILQRVFGRLSTLPQAVLNAAWLTGAYAAVAAIVWRALHDRRTQLVTVLLLVMFVQPVLYTPFLYGNLPGLCLALWSLYCLCRFVQGGKWLWLLPACLLIGLATLMKINFLILAVAMAATAVLYGLGTRRFAALLAAVCLLLSAVGVSELNALVMEKRTGAQFDGGITNMAWLVMGLSESPRAPGWYTPYPLDIAKELDYDMAAVSARASADLKLRLAELAADPAHAASFFHEKMVSQWLETTFESFWINVQMESRNPNVQLVAQLRSGPFANAATRYMDGFAFVVYAAFAAALALGVAALCRGSVTWDRAFPFAVLAVTVFGGFLYHLLFEAKSQYLFPYVVMMLPFAARLLSRPIRRG